MLAQIVLFDGFDPLDVIAPYEVLSAGQVRAELVSAQGAREVTSGLGLVRLAATGPLDPERAELVIVPGAAGGEDIPAILGRAAGTELGGLLRAALDRPQTTVATVCGGSLLLAMAGLVGGRHVTTHHDGRAALAATGAVVVDARVVDDGDLVSAAGVTSGLDLGLYLLEREVGAEAALGVERLFEHERRGTTWRLQSVVDSAAARA